MQNIFSFAEAAVEDYKKYSRSFSMIKSDDIKNKLEEFYCGDRLKENFCPEPLIQINPHYKTLETVSSLVQSGELHPRCKDIFRFGENPMRLYEHQVSAIACAARKKDFIVTTGTGSGKSLAFFIPIIDRVLREKKNGGTPHTRAIIIYPMNALANSQVAELSKFEKNSADSFTYAIYTGQESESQRKETAENPPDILLTNFMMMELLLTRHNENDSRVIEHCMGLEFLVLDELHTYRGRQGADVAMLIRRLRERTEARELICIGTSATMSNRGSAEDQASDVAHVGQTLFGSKKLPEVITEVLEHVTDPSLSIASVLPQLGPRVREYASGSGNLESFDDFGHDPLAVWVEHTLGIDDKDGSPTRAQSISLSEAAAKLATDVEGLSKEEASRALSAFLINSYMIKTPSGKPPFAFRLHQFLGAPGKLYLSLEPKGRRTITINAQKFVPGRANEEIRLYPAYFCRECGHEYVPVWYDKSSDKFLPREIDDTGDAGMQAGFLTPAPNDADETPAVIPDYWLDPAGDGTVKRDYRNKLPRKVLVAPNGKNGGGAAGVYWFIETPFRYCTECGVEAEARGRDINRLAGLTGEGRSSATTIIALSLLKKLFADQPHPSENETRKMLGFIDNRQDAALQSGHFNDFIFLISLRAAILEAVKEMGGSAKLNDLPSLMAKALGFCDGTIVSELEFMQKKQYGLAQKNAMAIMREVLGFRALRDIRRGWRFNNPNLEKLGLLEIDFEDIEGFTNEEKIFNKRSALSAMAPEDRLLLARLILADMARSMCISSHYLSDEDQQKMKSASYNILREPWNFEEDDFYYAKKLQIGGKKPKKDASVVSSGVGSRFLTNLKKRLPEQSPSLKNYCAAMTSSHYWVELARELCDAAAEYGIMKRSGDTSAAYYQIYDNEIIWKIPENTAAKNVNAYFKKLYADLTDDMEAGRMDVFRLESREHTAQIDNEERKRLERRFRYEEKDKAELTDNDGTIAKRLPLLFCSPTMELGVDIASLNVVYMRNVPPTPANYAQRSGRAGRSGQPALVVTYCGAQSPHDRWFFHHRDQMVQGSVTPPSIDLMNEELIVSHLHSIWLGEILYDLPSKISEVLDISDEKEEMPLKDPIAVAIHDGDANTRALKKALAHVKNLMGENRPEWLDEKFARKAIIEAPLLFDKTFDRWRALYLSTNEQAKRANKIINQLGGDPKKKEDACRRAAEAVKQQKVLAGDGGELNSDFNTYRYLANQGFLPGYNFPRLPLMAWVPGASAEDDAGRMISRQRFLAISEFGPRSLIYHRGKTFRVVRAKIDKATGQISADTNLPTESIKICANCGCGCMVSVEAEDNTSNVCANCGALLTDTGIINNLYRIEAVETKPVERISINDEERRRQGFEIQTAYQFLPGSSGFINIEKKTVANGEGKELASLVYSPSARIWKINKGWRRRKDKESCGFSINPMTGYWVKENNDDEIGEKQSAEDKAAENSRKQQVVPYVEDRRNVLILTPKEFMTKEEMATLLAALCRGIETLYEIEESELGAEALPNREQRRAILFYEASEGGAGVLSRIIKNSASLRAIAKKALEIAHYDYHNGDTAEKLLAEYDEKLQKGDAACETGCYNCLLSYYNQPDHELIDRRSSTVVKFLTELARCKEADAEAPQSNARGLTAEWLAKINALELRGPDETNITNGGIRADALYRSNLTLITIGKANSETREKAEAMGYRLIEFTEEPSEWPAQFAANMSVFGRGAI